MCSEIIYDNVFRNRLQQSVQKSPLHCVHELPPWCVYIIATLVFTNVRIAFCLKCFVWDVDVDECLLFVFFYPTCDILGYISIWIFLCKVKAVWCKLPMRRKNGDVYLSITYCYWSEVYVYTTEDYSANTIDVYVHNIICQSDGQLEFIYCVDVALVCSKYCIPCIYGFKYWTLYIFLIYECI